MTFLPAIEGFMLGAGLIIAIGAQNAFVIRQGVKGVHVFPVVAVCSLVDIALIGLGAGGVGTLIAQSAILQAVAAWGGAVFLGVYGALALHKAVNVKPGAWDEAERSASGRIGEGGAARAMLAALAFSLLNPHVYLDTVVMLGGLAAQYEPDARLLFALGAMAASVVWFTGIGYGAVRLAPFFRTTLGTRLLEGAVCLAMWTVAANLVIRELG
ncbi:MAG: LysE/ArgO family amino acid transporter [Rhodospirillales bacterium]